MQRPGFLLFLTVALSVYGLINGYILRRGWPAAAWMRPTRRTGLVLAFLFSAAAYPLGRLLGGALPPLLTDGLVRIGAFHFAFMVYFFLTLLVIDLFRFGRFLFRGSRKNLRTGNPSRGRLGFLIVTGLTGLTVAAGHWNALHPRVRTLEIAIPKIVQGPDRITLVVASDIHLGRIIRNHRLERIVRLINSQQPDLVLLPGDLTDEDISFLSEQNTGAVLRGIRAPLGVYGVTGNHEYYSGKAQAVSFLERSGIRILEDRVLELANGIRLVGRRDRTAERFGERRQPLADLLRGLPADRPVILMDHQPFHLEEARQNGVDLQLSGHTHNGQLFPGNLIVGRIYETAWGYLRKGATHVYVSCGVGTWGPPVRTCSIPEVVRIELHFRKGRESDRKPHATYQGNQDFLRPVSSQTHPGPT